MSSSTIPRIEKSLQWTESTLDDRCLRTVGVHCVLELYNCPASLLNNTSFIKEALRSAARKAQSTLLGEVSYAFSPLGVTALVLLAESHISIHTWPESGYAAADVFTCGEHTEPESACQYLVQAFQAEEHLLLKFPRRRLSASPLQVGWLPTVGEE
ncbi:MAG: adenosylmethionine decarboxylase [Hormoscilla sp.]